MKFCIIGPGEMPIPPKGWGAVEILIDDYRKTLEAFGHEVEIINTKDHSLITELVRVSNADFFHFQYDEWAYLASTVKKKNIAVTSHYGYLEQPSRWDSGYRNIFWQFVNSGWNIFCLSPGIKDVYKKAGVSEDRLHVIPNGVRTDLFRYSKTASRPEDSVYLAKIDFRKRQIKFQDIENLYFVGNCIEPKFDTSSSKYLGEWSKEKLYDSLTNFANLVLLSDGEAHPLVCLEAMSAGLGLVISEYSAANLQTNLPFIDVIPEKKIDDIEYVKSTIKRNREVSVSMREEIRKYAETFDWQKIVLDFYLKSVKKVCSKEQK